MPQETVNKLAKFFDSWKAILTVVGGLIVLVYQGAVIYLDVEDSKKEMEIVKTEFKKEVELINERAEKRYNRAMEVAGDLKKENDELERELEKHLIEDAYQRGKTDAVLNILKK